MDREAEFRKLLAEVDQEYFKKRDRSVKHVAPFLYEMDAAALVGDQLTWLN